MNDDRPSLGRTLGDASRIEVEPMPRPFTFRFGLAGKGLADPTSRVQAVDSAIRMDHSARTRTAALAPAGAA